MFYDHWEDGFEPNLPYSVEQASTEIYYVDRGEVISLKSDGSAGGVNQLVPTSPRGTGIRYDGGDRIVTLGGPVAVVHNFWPNGGEVAANGWENYAKSIVKDSFTYRVPVASDMFGTPNYLPFKHADITVAAFEDGTSLAINNGTDALILSLDQGQHFSTVRAATPVGCVDDVCDPAWYIEVNTGTEISTDKPSLAGMMTGNPGCVGVRNFNLLPVPLYGKEYVVPLEGGSVASNSETNYYIFNPNPEPAQVTVFNRDFPGPLGTTFTVPANGTTDYATETGQPVPVADGTSAIFADQAIYGIVVYNYNSDNARVRDWGFPLIPSRMLTRTNWVSWAPGNSAVPPNANYAPVWVTPLEDNTEVRFDLDNDGVWDQIDTTGDGLLNPGNCVGDPTCYLLDVLRVYDPVDFDNTGTKVVANKPVALSYGQDGNVAPAGGTALDLGYVVLPLEAEFVEPVFSVKGTPDRTYVPVEGGTRTITQVLRTSDYAPVEAHSLGLLVEDLVTYAPGSAVLVFPNGTTAQVEPLEQVVAGQRNLWWELDFDMFEYQEVRVSYDLVFAAGLDNRVYPLEITAHGTFVGQPVRPWDDSVQIAKTFGGIEKAGDTAISTAGDLINYSVCVSNTSSNPANVVESPVIRDRLPEGLIVHTIHDGGTFDPMTKTLRWNVPNLTVTEPVQCVGFVAETVFLPATSREIFNVAELASDNIPPLFSNAVATEIHSPRIRMTISQAPPDYVRSGGIIEYTITVTNISQVAASNVRVIDNLPPGLSYVDNSLRINYGWGWIALTDADDMDEGTWISAQNQAEFVIGTLQAGATVQLRLRGRVDPAPDGTLFVNYARGLVSGVPEASDCRGQQRCVLLVPRGREGFQCRNRVAATGGQCQLHDHA